MNFKEYIKTLLPSMSKTQLVEDLDRITQELEDHALPAYKTAVETIGSKPLNSPEAQRVQKTFKKNYKGSVPNNHLKLIHDVLKNAKQHCETIDKMIDDKFVIDIHSAGMDIIRVNILQLVEILGFVVRYSRRHLNYIVACEIAHYNDEDVNDKFSEAEREWLESARRPFIDGLGILAIPGKELETKFKEVPDALITHETVDATVEVVGRKAADPLEMRFIPLVINPIYHVRLRIAEYQANRYKEAQEERRSVELRLLLLKDQQAGRDNAKVEEQIAYQEERRKKLTYKIQKMEDKYVN